MTASILSFSSIVFLIFPKKNLNPLHHASPPFFACELTFLSFSEFPLLSFLQNTVCLFNMPPQFFLKYIISFPFPFKICFNPKHYWILLPSSRDSFSKRQITLPSLPLIISFFIHKLNLPHNMAPFIFSICLLLEPIW